MSNENKYRANSVYYRKRLQKIVNGIDFTNKKIVDLGCGEMILKDLLSNQNVHYIGIDTIDYGVSSTLNQISVGQYFIPKADYIFAIGLVDHLDDLTIWNLYENISNSEAKYLIIGVRNVNTIWPWVVNRNLRFDLKNSLPKYRCTHEKFILKFPFYKQCIELQKEFFARFFSTEVVYYFELKQ